MYSDKSFFTVASGKKYLDFAFQLARSYQLWNSKTDFYIISDADFELPIDLQKIKKKIVENTLVNNSLGFKLKLNTLSPTAESIFIDSDCLIYSDIQNLFKRFEGSDVNVIGFKITDNTWAGLDIEKTLVKYNLPYIIRYNGGFYYIKKGEFSNKVFAEANRLFQESEEFEKHHAGTNEEPIMSIAMSANNVTPVHDDGSIMGDLVHSSRKSNFNILKGRPVLINPSENEPRHKFWMASGIYSPSIIHFGSGIYNKWPYLQDRVRLYMYNTLRLPDWTANLFTCIIVTIPYHFLKRAKKIF